MTARSETTEQDTAQPGRIPAARRNRSWHALWIPLCLGLGAMAAIFAAARRFVDVDAVSYLDLTDAYLEGGWSAGANAYWSPLYPLLLAGAFRLAAPVGDQELVVTQVVNWSIFAVSLAFFVAFWREVRTVSLGDQDPHAAIPVPEWLWWGIGYLLFLWCTLRLIKVWTITPDMLVLGSALAAGWLLLRIRRKPESWRLPVALGVVLAIGYLSKAVMFLVGFVIVAAVAAALWSRRGMLARTALVAIIFVAVSAPFIVTLSAQKGRFTFGDAGRLNYARYVNGVPDHHWQGNPPGSGTPVRPSRMISTDPPAFEFRAPFAATFPTWYDPSYWYEGVTPRFDRRQQLGALIRGARDYLYLLLPQSAAVAVVLLLLFAGGRNRRWGLAGLRNTWFVLIPVVAAFGLYGLVYVETRYLAPFVLLSWGVLLAAVGLPPDRLSRPLIQGGGFIILLVFALNLFMPNEKALSTFLRSPNSGWSGQWFDAGPSGSSAHVPAALALGAAGLEPGDEIAYIGYPYYAYWARLAGLRLVAEVPHPASHDFWAADDAGRNEITRLLFSTGAAAIVTEADGGYPPPAGWQRLGNTAYYLLLARER